MAIETLRSIYEKIPNKWKLWIVSFVAGLIIIWIWDVGVLLEILLCSFFLAYIVFWLFGDRNARAVGEFSMTHFFTRIRGMLLFALFPAVWELISDFSVASLVALGFVGIIALTIWDRFDEIIKSFNKEAFSTRRRRRRR